LAGYEIVQGPLTKVGGLQFGTAYADCPAGKRPVGGGGSITSTFLTIVASQPKIFRGPPGWEFRVRNNSFIDMNFQAYAVCVNA
jgi:hypothetical protein